MKRVFAVSLVSMLLFSALAGALFVNLATANFIPPPEASPLVVTVQLPETKVYTKNYIPVAFTIQRKYSVMRSSGESKFFVEKNPQCSCFLDGKEILLKTTMSADWNCYSYTATLSGLSAGVHRLVISASYTYYSDSPRKDFHRPASGVSDAAVFTVTDAALHVLVYSPYSAETYNPTTLPLNFSVSKPASWMGYSLDDEAPVTITGNTTLSNLSEGTHMILVQAKDALGSIGVSKPVMFKVETEARQAAQPPEPQTAPFPITLVDLSIVASATVVGIVLLVYFKKR
jgi:hypothetical protein